MGVAIWGCNRPVYSHYTYPEDFGTRDGISISFRTYRGHHSSCSDVFFVVDARNSHALTPWYDGGRIQQAPQSRRPVRRVTVWE